MLGHRGCRLGNTYPEITEMQTRYSWCCVSIESQGIVAKPEIMVPLVGIKFGFNEQDKLFAGQQLLCFAEKGDSIEFKGQVL